MFSRLFTVIMIFITVGIMPAKAWMFTQNNISYTTLDESTATVTGCDKSLVDAVIPETVDYDGTTYTVVAIANNAFNGNSTLETLTAPESIKSTGTNIFFFAKKIREVSLPGVTSLGESAFYLSSVAKVTLGAALTALPKDAFNSCSSLREVDLSNIRNIGRTAFRKCTLDNVDIADGTTLDVGAFQESNIASMTMTGNITLPTGSTAFDKAKVTHLTLIDVNFSGSTNAVNPAVDKLDIYQTLSTPMNIGFTPYQTGAKSIYLDADTKTLESSSSMSPFCNSATLQDVTFGPQATLIKASMFYNCPQLRTVKFSANVTEVEKTAFENCNAITSVECDSPVPPACSPDAFTATAYANATLQVPQASLEAYAAAEGWSKFTNIKGAVSGLEDIATDDNNLVKTDGSRIVFLCSPDTKVSVYTFDGRLVYSGAPRDITPGHGCYIVMIGHHPVRLIL